MIIKESTRASKKYMVFYNNHWIHFGDRTMQQFRDSTPLKLYSYLDHNDPVRRQRYLARAKGIRDANGNLTYSNPNLANFYSVHFLW
jgi:hypothetical protein